MRIRKDAQSFETLPEFRGWRVTLGIQLGLIFRENSAPFKYHQSLLQSIPYSSFTKWAIKSPLPLNKTEQELKGNLKFKWKQTVIGSRRKQQELNMPKNYGEKERCSSSTMELAEEWYFLCVCVCVLLIDSILQLLQQCFQVCASWSFHYRTEALY